jgi:hypothetical protein
MTISPLVAVPKDLQTAYFSGVQEELAGGSYRTHEDLATLTCAEVDGILELAVMVSTSDGVSAREERTAIDALAMRLVGNKTTSDAAYARVIAARHAGTLQQRFAEITGVITRRLARELAYSICLTMTMVDLATDTREDEFMRDLVRALAISGADEDNLYATLMAQLCENE